MIVLIQPTLSHLLLSFRPFSSPSPDLPLALLAPGPAMALTSSNLLPRHPTSATLLKHDFRRQTKRASVVYNEARSFVSSPLFQASSPSSRVLGPPPSPLEDFWICSNLNAPLCYLYRRATELRLSVHVARVFNPSKCILLWLARIFVIATSNSLGSHSSLPLITKFLWRVGAKKKPCVFAPCAWFRPSFTPVVFGKHGKYFLGVLQCLIWREI